MAEVGVEDESVPGVRVPPAKCRMDSGAVTRSYCDFGCDVQHYGRLFLAKNDATSAKDQQRDLGVADAARGVRQL